MGDTVLVTDATCFISSHVIKLLLEKGYKVKATVSSLYRSEADLEVLRRMCPDAKFPLEVLEMDLLTEKGWDELVGGCQYVMLTGGSEPEHLASSDESIVTDSVQATLNVLRACRAKPDLKRVVMTSSVAAKPKGWSTKEQGDAPVWTDDTLTDRRVFARSKSRAQRAAWEFVSSLSEKEKFQFTVINAGYAFGPLLTNRPSMTHGTLRKMMLSEDIFVPRVHLPSVDVRDLAAVHVEAMINPVAADNAFDAVHEGIWLQNVATLLHEEFTSMGYCVSYLHLPEWLFRMYTYFRSDLSVHLPMYDRKVAVDNKVMVDALHVTPAYSAHDSVLQSVHSMVEKNLMPKKSDGKLRCKKCKNAPISQSSSWF